MTLMILHCDAKELGYCNAGMREFFENHHLDWSEFVCRGLPIEAFAGIDDVMLENAIQQAIKRESETTHGR